MLNMPLLLLTLAAAPAQALDCPVASLELDLHLRQALAALDARRFLDFEQSRQQVEGELDCLVDVLKGEPLAHLHQVYTARAWLDGDAGGLLAGLRGLRHVSSGFELPADWTEGNDRVEALYREAVRVGPGREARLPSRLVVDGRMASERLPLQRSAVVQIRNPEGSWSTWYVPPGEPTSTWLTARAVVEDEPEEPAAPVPVPALVGESEE